MLSHCSLGNWNGIRPANERVPIILIDSLSEDAV